VEYHDYLNQIQIYDSEAGINFCDELSALLNAPTEEPEEINNGIEITNVFVPGSLIIPGDLIAFTDYRFPHNPPGDPAPDLDFGVDGDDDIISALNSPMLFWSNQQLEDRMVDLLHFASIGQYQTVSDKYFDKFEEGSGDFYTDDDISDLIKETTEVRNKVKQFGKDFENRLKSVNGDISQLSPTQLDGQLRYSFTAGKGYLFMGPTILINDISQVKYHLQDFNIDMLGNWQGTFYTEVVDHFGLDDTDPNIEYTIWGYNVAIYQHLHSGFAAWWILQHQRAYVPFRTRIRFVITIEGKI